MWPAPAVKGVDGIMPKFKYEVAGTAAANSQTWSTSGTMVAELGDFARLPERCMRESFMQLTQGKATYGNPGIGCKGPYSITKLLIEEVPYERGKS